MQLDILNILAIGRNSEIMEVLARLLNAREKWKGTAVTSDAEALEAMRQEQYTIVLLCAGIIAHEEEALKQALLAINPAAIIVQHYGGGSGLLYNEIQAILDTHQITLN